jgi:NAD(P)H-hydrate repair Nnr-like enzyme with NAD(P)H-hydrate dehydratase domain
MRGPVGLLLPVVLKDRVAYGDALVANISTGVVGGRGDQLPDNILALMAERTTQRIIGACTLHGISYTAKRMTN